MINQLQRMPKRYSHDKIRQANHQRHHFTRDVLSVAIVDEPVGLLRLNSDACQYHYLLRPSKKNLVSTTTNCYTMAASPVASEAPDDIVCPALSPTRWTPAPSRCKSKHGIRANPV